MTTDFLRDLDVSNDDQVREPRALDVGINAGGQVFPQMAEDQNANRLLIFAGTATFQVAGSDDGVHGVIRVRLQYPMPKTIILKGSATVAALASLHGTDDEDSLFAVDAVETVLGPTDNGRLPDSGLPKDELYIVMDAAVFGDHAVLMRIAYQANVLVQDTEPDLDSILVRRAGLNVAFTPQCPLMPDDQWEYQINLTGPVTGATFTVSLGSDSGDAPVPPFTQLSQLQMSASFPGGTIPANAPQEEITITAKGRRVTKTAKLVVTTLR